MKVLAGGERGGLSPHSKGAWGVMGTESPFEELNMEEIDRVEFQIKNLASAVAFLKGLNIPEKRLQFEEGG